MNQKIICALILFGGLSAWAIPTPNDFQGTDSERIEAAIQKACKSGDRSIEIPRMNQIRKDSIWLIDRAILLPDDFTLVLRDCLIRLAPGVQDNIIRNAGATETSITTNRNITIQGIGRPVLSGGLKSHFDPPGDKCGWPTLSILFCAVQGFTIDNVTLQETQCWGITMENGCCNGRVSNITFDDTNKNPNQDGVDVRKGCHDILIENIFGRVGDDAVALTGLRRLKGTIPANQRKFKRRIQIGGCNPTADDDIYNITIRNVQCTCLGGHGIIRLLNQDGIKMYNIIIRDIIDTSKENNPKVQAAIRIGDRNYWSISRSKMGEMKNILVDGVMTRGRAAIKISGPLQDSVIRNIFIPSSGTQKLNLLAPIECVTIE